MNILQIPDFIVHDILYDLNEDQKKAVTATKCPLMIIAGPGTGKTLTIMRRIAYLIHQGVKPENIMAVTFTNRAAREMRERTEALLGVKAEEVFIGTLHLLGLRIIQDNFSNAFHIYNRNEQSVLLKTILKDSGRKIQQALDRISRIKSLIEEADNGIKEIYEKYQSALMKNSAFDFDDLILKPIALLGKVEILERYKKRFQYIMVDEYQDINPAQYKLLNLLTKNRCFPFPLPPAIREGRCDSSCLSVEGKDEGYFIDDVENNHVNFCVIGDPDQAIYAFRGADVENFLNFQEDYRGAKRISLAKNYRSTGMIIDASNAIIKNNKKRIANEVESIRDNGNPVTIVSVPDEKAEGNSVIREIECRIGGTSHYQLMQKDTSRKFLDSSYRFSDFAVLFRTNAQAKALEDSFLVSGIPYQLIGKPNINIKKESINVLREKFDKMDGELCIDDLLNEIVNAGLFDNFGDNDMIFLRNMFTQYCLLRPSEAIKNIINELSLLSPEDAYNPESDAVTLTTLHMAKGLEFKVVFITGVEEGLVPYTMKKEGTNIEEERRLFFVGMTRAKDELFLIHARKRFLYGQRLVQSPSSFIREIPEKFVEKKFVCDGREKQQRDRQIGLF